MQQRVKSIPSHIQIETLQFLQKAVNWLIANQLAGNFQMSTITFMLHFSWISFIITISLVDCCGKRKLARFSSSRNGSNQQGTIRSPRTHKNADRGLFGPFSHFSILAFVTFKASFFTLFLFSGRYLHIQVEGGRLTTLAAKGKKQSWEFDTGISCSPFEAPT